MQFHYVKDYYLMIIVRSDPESIGPGHRKGTTIIITESKDLISDTIDLLAPILGSMDATVNDDCSVLMGDRKNVLKFQENNRC